MISKRQFLAAGSATALAGMLIGSPFQALAQDDAATFIDSMARQAIALAQHTRSSTLVQPELRQLVDQRFDLPLIGRFALGRHWNTATPEQRQEYLRLFEETIVRTYSRRFEGYAGQTLVVLGARSAGSQGDTLVQTELSQASGLPIAVDWRVRESSGAYRVIDVQVSGISMAVTQRDEFNSIIVQRGGEIEGLLRVLRQRVSA